jgi:hypothetical protein
MGMGFCDAVGTCPSTLGAFKISVRCARPRRNIVAVFVEKLTASSIVPGDLGFLSPRWRNCHCVTSLRKYADVSNSRGHSSSCWTSGRCLECTWHPSWTRKDGASLFQVRKSIMGCTAAGADAGSEEEALDSSL